LISLERRERERKERERERERERIRKLLKKLEKNTLEN
jgi:hypothetical protein